MRGEALDGDEDRRGDDDRLDGFRDISVASGRPPHACDVSGEAAACPHELEQ